MVKGPEFGFNGKKFKPLIQQALIRINVMKKKKSALIQTQKKSVANCLQNGQTEKARLETERIIKADWLVEALDLCELFCETVRDNAQLIVQEKRCPLDLEEAVVTLTYCSYRTEVKELKTVVKMLKKKYGSEFVDLAQQNRGGIVNPRIVHKLSGQRPNAFLVVQYMTEIAQKFNIAWEPDEVDKEMGQRFDTAMVTPDGSGQKAGGASGLGGAAYGISDGRILRPGEKPKGYVPPNPNLDTIIPLDDGGKDDDDNDNDDDNGGGGGGGGMGDDGIPIAQAVDRDEENTVNEHAVRGNEAPPKKRVQYQEKPAPKKKKEMTGGDLDALQARLNKLKNS